MQKRTITRSAVAIASAVTLSFGVAACSDDDGDDDDIDNPVDGVDDQLEDVGDEIDSETDDGEGED